jgi:ATP-dependent Lon protease
MRRAGTINPVFMLDEIDKLGRDFRGDPSAALLEVLDPEQNFAFSDHYLEVPYDLSKVLFITTANTLETVPPALLDRMEVIEFSGYTDYEKLEIARRYLIPRQLEQHGLVDKGIHLEDKTVHAIIRQYTYEAGVRNLEREIANVCRKIARRVASNRAFRKRVTPDSLLKFLGPPEFLENKLEDTDQVGLAMGVAWSEGGGDLMEVEISLMPGKGGLTLTGQLGEVMQESVQAAQSYLRSRAHTLGLKESVFEKTDVHVHLPETAIPKDGPSAGITVAAAMISAFTGRKVLSKIAMTGEITLRGRVLPVGGIKEKILTCHRSGIRSVIIPERNSKDLVNIPRKVLSEMNIIMVKGMDEVLSHALAPAEPKPRRARKTDAAKASKPKVTRRPGHKPTRPLGDPSSPASPLAPASGGPSAR